MVGNKGYTGGRMRQNMARSRRGCLCFIRAITGGAQIPRISGLALIRTICTTRLRETGATGVGEENPGAKLTEVDVRQMRARYAAGESRKSLARRFRTSRSNVDLIVTRRRWAHVGNADQGAIIITDGQVA